MEIALDIYLKEKKQKYKRLLMCVLDLSEVLHKHNAKIGMQSRSWIYNEKWLESRHNIQFNEWNTFCCQFITKMVFV